MNYVRVPNTSRAISIQHNSIWYMWCNIMLILHCATIIIILILCVSSDHLPLVEAPNPHYNHRLFECTPSTWDNVLNNKTRSSRKHHTYHGMSISAHHSSYTTFNIWIVNLYTKHMQCARLHKTSSKVTTWKSCEEIHTQPKTLIAKRQSCELVCTFKAPIKWDTVRASWALRDVNFVLRR